MDGIKQLASKVKPFALYKHMFALPCNNHTTPAKQNPVAVRGGH
jgi:hypothetical protein